MENKYEFKGSPAPWSAKIKSINNGVLGKKEGFNSEVCFGENNHADIWIHDGDSFEHKIEICKHNVHLISASPELLTAAINALDLVTRLWNNECPINYNEYSYHHDELSSAIHKALNITI